MKNDDGRKSEGAPERSLKAGVGVPSGVDGNSPKRFSVQRKMAIVARLLRGEPLELVAREANVSIARLSEWRERALSTAEGAPDRMFGSLVLGCSARRWAIAHRLKNEAQPLLGLAASP